MSEDNIISVENEIKEDTEEILADLKSQLEDSRKKKDERLKFSKDGLIQHIDMIAMKFDAVSGYKAVIDAMMQLGMECMTMNFTVISCVLETMNAFAKIVKRDVEENIDDYDSYDDLLDKHIDMELSNMLNSFVDKEDDPDTVAAYIICEYLKANMCSSISDILDNIVEFDKRADEEIQRIEDEIAKIEHGE